MISAFLSKKYISISESDFLIVLVISPYKEIERRPTPTIFKRRKNSTTLKYPPPVINPRITASPTSIRQNVPCATVNIRFTDTLEKGSQVFHKSESERSSAFVVEIYFTNLRIEYIKRTSNSLISTGMPCVV